MQTPHQTFRTLSTYASSHSIAAFSTLLLLILLSSCTGITDPCTRVEIYHAGADTDFKAVGSNAQAMVQISTGEVIGVYTMDQAVHYYQFTGEALDYTHQSIATYHATGRVISSSGIAVFDNDDLIAGWMEIDPVSGNQDLIVAYGVISGASITWIPHLVQSNISPCSELLSLCSYSTLPKAKIGTIIYTDNIRPNCLSETSNLRKSGDRVRSIQLVFPTPSNLVATSYFEMCSDADDPAIALVDYTSSRDVNITASGDTAIAMWEEDTTHKALWYRITTDKGATWSDAHIISTISSPFGEDPNLAMSQDTFYVVYHNGNSIQFGYLARASASPDFTISSTGGLGYFGNLEAKTTSAGELLLFTWEQLDATGIPNAYQNDALKSVGIGFSLNHPAGFITDTLECAEPSFNTWTNTLLEDDISNIHVVWQWRDTVPEPDELYLFHTVSPYSGLILFP